VNQAIPHQATLRFFTQKDCPPDALVNERIAVVGYGNLGRSLSLNLRDAGAGPAVGGDVGGPSAGRAREDGFTMLSPAEAARGADVLLVLLPDEVIPEVFSQDIQPNLRPGAAVVFASGYCLAYHLIDPRPDLDVLMLAPRMGGEMIRQHYQRGEGFHAYLSVERDASGTAWRRLLGLAGAVGALRAVSFELDARREVDLDLFVEQTLGAVVGFAVMTAFSVGVDGGLPPEALALEMFMSGEMETVWRGFRTRGFENSATTHGPTAQFGGLIRSLQLLATGLPQQFRKTFEEIHSGQFASQFQAERQAGYPMLKQVGALVGDRLQPIAAAEARLREVLPQP
jgi:ketol-acid reductoisomerase